MCRRAYQISDPLSPEDPRPSEQSCLIEAYLVTIPVARPHHPAILDSDTASVPDGPVCITPHEVIGLGHDARTRVVDRRSHEVASW